VIADLVQNVMASPVWKAAGNTAIVITFDENDKEERHSAHQGCCGYDPDSKANFGGGRIPTLVITNQRARKVVDDTPYNHYSLLRTTEAAFGIDEYLGHAADASRGVVAMSALFAVKPSPIAGIPRSSIWKIGHGVGIVFSSIVSGPLWSHIFNSSPMSHDPSGRDQPLTHKVPEVTFLFWLIKIAATTLGETAGDAVTMSMHLGYLTGTAIFAALFVIGVRAQVSARRLHIYLYWAVIVATTTVGTTLADLLDRSLGIGYAGGSSILLVLVIATLLIWRRTLGTVAVSSITTPAAETFYWTTILFSQTLGTALGDWTADKQGLGQGYQVAALVFAAALAIIAMCYFATRLSHALLFWTAFVLTRPLGATVGDWLDKPLTNGGMAMSRYSASAVLLAIMIVFILFDSRLQRRSRIGPQATPSPPP
jgi:uncharacterized membrane-anchored protein